MNPQRLVCVLSLLTACGQAPVARPAAPLQTTTNPSPNTADAANPPDAAAPVDPRREAVLSALHAAGGASASPALAAGPVDYAVEGDGARVAAVGMEGATGFVVVTPVPHAAGQEASASFGLASMASEGAVAGLIVRDFDGDHRSDLAVFTGAEPHVEGWLPLQHFAHFFTLVTTPERALRTLGLVEAELLGVRTEAEVAEALPTLGHFEAPRAGQSPVRFLTRLRYATPAEFRQVVPRTGLRLCVHTEEANGSLRKRCTTYAVARLTDALITGRIREGLSRFVGTDSGFPGCPPNPENQVRCEAHSNHGVAVSCGLSGEGASMRLVELSTRAEGAPSR